MVKFKIGDEVRAIGDVAFIPLKGFKGTVVHILNSSYPIGVEFEKEIKEGHSCTRHGKEGYCRYGTEYEFELISFDWDK